MLKAGSKRRRTKRQIEADEAEELAKENEYRSKVARLEMIEQQLRATEEQARVNRQAADLVSDMINAGVIQQESENTFVVANNNQEQRFDVAQQPDQGWDQLWLLKDSVLFEYELGSGCPQLGS